MNVIVVFKREGEITLFKLFIKIHPLLFFLTSAYVCLKNHKSRRLHIGNLDWGQGTMASTVWNSSLAVPSLTAILLILHTHQEDHAALLA